jgi:hypothetical protein
MCGRVGREALPVVTGHATFPEDGSDAEQLVGEADRRMFRTKHELRMSAATAQESSSSSINWLQ